MEKLGFYVIMLPFKGNMFEELSNAVTFETVGKGRKGNHLVRVSKSEIPIVRTTTKYSIPAHDFSSSHKRVLNSLESVININYPNISSLSFNNALIEVYDETYTKMKYHCDQCLDLESNSYIALFSCYEQPENITKHVLRKLKIKNKTSGEEFEFLLENNSVILFSLETNEKFQHKIVLEQVSGKREEQTPNKWLGITFRQSKTKIHFKEGKPCFSNGKELKLANEQEAKTFYILRGEENRSLGFTYPTIEYTLSIGDILKPKE